MSWIRPLFAAAILVAAAGPATAGPIMSDPVGDTFAGNPGGPDIIGISADTFNSAGDAVFAVYFNGPISPPSAFAPNSVVGYIDIDVDRNAGTGNAFPLTSVFGGPPPFNIGAELTVDLFSELFNPGNVDVLDSSTFLPVASVPITYFSNGFTFTLPNALFGDPNPRFGYAGVVGDFTAPSDRVPNGAELLLSTPEPTSLAVFGVLGLVATGYVRRRRTATA